MKLYYEKKCEILLRDCDMFQRLRPSAVLAMFQDCSEDLTEGWQMGLNAMRQKGLIWVSAKAECAVRRLPIHGESVTVRGWAGRSRSGIYPFRYVILDRMGEELISGCSMWVLSDLETHSMLSPNVPRLSMPTPEEADTPFPRMRVIAPPLQVRQTQRQVRFSEVDINGHLTNTRYVDWLCDLIEPSFHETHPMTGLRINYHAETFPQETVAMDWELTDSRLWCASRKRFEAAIYF